MPDDIGTIATNAVAKVCPSSSCPYRYGNAEDIKKRLAERLIQKISHRLADGKEVRKLESRVTDLEKVLKMCLAKALSNTTFTLKELGDIKRALNPDKKG